MVKGHDFHKRGLELLPRLGVLVVKFCSIQAPGSRDDPNRHILLEAEAKKLDAATRSFIT